MLRASLLALFFIAPLAHSIEPQVAGTIQKIRGAALTNHQSSSENLSVGMKVLIGDRIVTGTNTRVALEMNDGAILTLGADTEFVINDYRYSKKLQQGSASLELLKGAFRAVTGAIGKLKERDFKIRTKVATIGIRGTDFWGGFYFSQALDVALLDGKGIYIENTAGKVEITTQGDGTTIQTGSDAPSVPIHWGDKKINAAKQSVSWD